MPRANAPVEGTAVPGTIMIYGGRSTVSRYPVNLDGATIIPSRDTGTIQRAPGRRGTLQPY